MNTIYEYRIPVIVIKLSENRTQKHYTRDEREQCKFRTGKVKEKISLKNGKIMKLKWQLFSII